MKNSLIKKLALGTALVGALVLGGCEKENNTCAYGWEDMKISIARTKDDKYLFRGIINGEYVRFDPINEFNSSMDGSYTERGYLRVRRADGTFIEYFNTQETDFTKTKERISLVRVCKEGRYMVYSYRDFPLEKAQKQFDDYLAKILKTKMSQGKGLF